MSGVAGAHPAMQATVAGQTFQRVIAVNPYLNLDAVKSITANNGYDEVILRTADNRIYAAVGPGGKLNVQAGFVGMVNGQWAQVVHVDDEVNSAAEGAKAPFKAVSSLFRNMGATAATAMVTTTVGGMMAATAVSSASAPAIGHLARSAGSAFTAALSRLAVTGAVGLGISGIVLGVWSGISAIRGATRQGNELTLQMLA